MDTEALRAARSVLVKKRRQLADAWARYCGDERGNVVDINTARA
jgi:hypothetical protein